ncbi:MAG: peptidoglycan DD-metalloendopeptidase family protein [Microvirga sp.]|nr:peptidoglycan DD-metalloendopeptidase family protein [Microvirga sp.]
MRRRAAIGDGTATAKRAAAAAFGFFVALALSSPLLAQNAAPDAPQAQPAEASEEELARRALELQELQQALDAAAQAQRTLDEEIARIVEDRATLNEALIDTSARIRENEDRSADLESRLETLIAAEAAIRRSLDSRRGVIVEVLAALQRMGRRPPPAVLVQPEDILAAVRTSMLLGAVVPELRAETQALADDLAELVRLRTAIADDRIALAEELAALDRERIRVAALIDARQESLRVASAGVADESARVAELAARAGDLKELIDGMEQQIAASRTAALAAREAGERLAAETRRQFAAAAALDPARLAPQIPFAEARGMLTTPVGGQVLRAFGAPDDFGGAMRGVSFESRSGEIVTAPADGWVAYAGPFRSFERLLIINVGDDYYILMAGMEAINVEVGQFVLAGEPVATMGPSWTPSPATGVIDADGPVLYVEFRKDGGSIDPSSWWQARLSEKVRG